MTAAPILQTERLILRPPCGDDVPSVLHFFGSGRARFYGGPIDAPAAWRRLSAYAGQWLLRGYGIFAVLRRDTGETVGLAGPIHPNDFPEPEMSWLLTDAAHEGRGYAREASAATLAHLFGDLGWTDVVSYIDPANTASLKLAERLGARPDAAAAVPLALPGCLAFRHRPESRG